MARTLNDILRRLRPAVAPGPAAPAGVPADRASEAEAELAGVFAALAPAVAEARRLVDEARLASDRRREAGAAEASRLVEAARAQVEAARAEAMTGWLASVDSGRESIEADARGEIGRIEAASAARVDDLVTRALTQIWALAGLVEVGHGAGPVERAGPGLEGTAS